MTGAKLPSKVSYHDVVIVGSGFSGIGMAIALKKAGRNNFVLLEKAGDIGGTWRDNHYPGAACDVPSHLYSYSFEPNPRWTRAYSPQPEILAYMKHCASKYGVLPHVRLNSELVEARWNPAESRWHLKTGDGQTLITRVLVSGIGGLSRPVLPKVPGLANFQGTIFHSAQWNHDYDLRGKRVAVVGTGASAIQFVPQIAPKVAKLLLLQRTPPWILPKLDGDISKRAQTLFKFVPGAQWLLRSGIYWQNELFALGFLNPGLMGAAQKLGLSYLHRKVKDPELRAKLTPDYTPGCKRILLTNDYYPAITRRNVEVVAAGVQEVRAHSVVDAHGREHAVDAIICGTGFDVADPIGPLKIYGGDGRELREVVGKNLKSYLGVAMHQVPNVFFLLGPNTGLGHTSIIFMIEAQIHYVMQCLAKMDQLGASTMEVKPAAQEAFMRRIYQQFQRTVWNTGGCKSWYLNEQGENFTLWPSYTWRYWLATRKLDAADFSFVRARQGVAP